MKEQVQLEEKEVLIEEKRKGFKIKFKKQKISHKDQIFKIVLTGILLGLSVALSLIEIKIPIMGASVPLRVFDALVMAIAIPVIGIWYTLLIAIVEPWLHFALDSDHPPIQIFFDNIANLVFVVSFVVIFYKLFKLNHKKSDNHKSLIVKHSFAALVLVSLNAIVSSLAFVFTIVLLATTNLTKPEEYLDVIIAFYQNASVIFFILLAIEFARFLFIYFVFALVQKRLSNLNRFQVNAN